MKFTVLFLLVLGSSLITFPLHAAETKFQVMQKGTGDPVAGATIVNLDTEEFATSDDQGKAVLDGIQFPVRLRVLTPGYMTYEQTLSEDNAPIELYLEPLESEGEAITVIEERIVEKSSKVSLPAEELRIAPGSSGDPLKVIQSLPGVVSAAEGTGVVYIRGSEPNQNITWVDRTPIGYLYHFGGLYSTINSGLVADFNVFLAGFPVEYGDAMGGAIDINLRDPRTDRLHQQYSIGTFESSFLLEGPVPLFEGDSFFISGRRSYLDFIFDPEQLTNFFSDEEEQEDEQDEIIEVPRFYDMQINWRHKIKRGTVSFNFFTAKDELALLLRSPGSTDPQATGKISNESSYSSYSVVSNYRLSNQVSLLSTLAYINPHFKLQIGTDENGEPFYFDLTNRDLQFQPELRWFKNERSEYSFGSQVIYRESPIDAYIARPPDESDTTFDFTSRQKFRIDRLYKAGVIAPYVKHRYAWTDKFTTNIGMRFTKIRATGGIDLQAFSPRASVEYQLFPKTLVTASWGRYVQLPEGHETSVDSGNPKLRFEDSQHRVLGVKHDITPDLMAQVEFYHKPMTDLVVIIDENEPPDNYQNRGHGESYGFDILLKRNYNNGKMGWLSYSYLESTRTNEITGVTRGFNGDQPHTFTAVWSQRLSGSWRKWTVGLRLRVNSGKPYTPVIGVREEPYEDGVRRVAITAEKNSERLPAFVQLDLRLDRRFLFNTWKMNAYLDILNVTNRQNVTGYDYGDDLENVDNPEESTSLPIFPSFGIEAKF